MILAGRRINDNMALYVTTQVVKQMLGKGIQPASAKVLVLGLAFKENCPDVRNTKVVDIVEELASYGAAVDVHDPWCNADEARREYGLDLVADPKQGAYDVVIIAVAHDEFRALGADGICAFTKDTSVLYDIKYVLPPELVDGRL
jgi:UDP-N-acetyl-D-galactosamine dehydrogenase